jgi:uncharacterized protein (TIGR02996 family)
MSDRDALMRAVLDQPADDAPRLVLADWFEEHGQAERAEFIRTQCEIARLGAGGGERLGALAEREKALYEARTPTWYEEVPKRARNNVVFRRGFPSGIRCTPTQWLGARKLTRSVPIESLDLGGRDPGRLPQVAEAPHLGVVTALGASLYEHALVPPLLGSPHLGNLRWLDLGSSGHSHGSSAADPVVAVLAQTPALARLEGLRLSCSQLGPRGLAYLAASPHLTQLRRLDVDDNFYGDEGIEALAGSPVVANLVALNVRNAQLRARAARAIACFPRLTHLSLQFNAIGDRGAEALAASRNLSGLEYLNLYGNQIGDEGVRSLARSPHLAHLRTLELGANGWTAAGIEAIGASAAFPSLERLGLRFDPGTPTTPDMETVARALIGSPNLPRLREVNFQVYWVDGFVRREMEARLSSLHGATLMLRRW